MPGGTFWMSQTQVAAMMLSSPRSLTYILSSTATFTPKLDVRTRTDSNTPIAHSEPLDYALQLRLGAPQHSHCTRPKTDGKKYQAMANS